MVSRDAYFAHTGIPSHQHVCHGYAKPMEMVLFEWCVFRPGRLFRIRAHFVVFRGLVSKIAGVAEENLCVSDVPWPLRNAQHSTAASTMGHFLANTAQLGC